MVLVSAWRRPPWEETQDGQAEKVWALTKERNYNKKPRKGHSWVQWWSFSLREEKKKQKQEEAEEKTEIPASGSTNNQGSKAGGEVTQQPLKRGQKVGASSGICN